MLVQSSSSSSAHSGSEVFSQPRRQRTVRRAWRAGEFSWVFF